MVIMMARYFMPIRASFVEKVDESVNYCAQTAEYYTSLIAITHWGASQYDP